MANYTHGIYGTLKDAVVPNAAEASSATVAVGTLPVHLLADYTGMVGVPIAMSNATAKSEFGYSDSWDKFTLCEVMQSFLGGSSDNIGGLYCINVLDPATHKAASDTEVSVTFADGVGTITDELAIVSTIAVDGITADNTSASYDWVSGKTTIRATGATGAKDVTYRRVTPNTVAASDIVSAIAAIDDLYPLENVIPNILIAPGWSDNPTVYAALVSKTQAIDEHFLGFVLADIPTSAATIEAAIAWKASNGYTSKYSKVCWPCASDASGKIYHLSTLYAREMVRNDARNDGVPYVTASNTVVSSGGVCLANGTTVKLYNEHGNSLNEYGISTAIAWGGQVRLWGGHTAGFIDSAADNEASAIFDTNIRMLCYIINGFQTRWINSIDQPMTIALRDTILFSEQSLLDGLVAQGALVGSPTVAFLPSSNTPGDIIQGNFTWDISATPTPQFKTARAVVAYTTDGFDAYIESDGE
ncbi:MAG: hypothetical protein IJ087_00215 [Eggerthellaceae bacterium]|nr:hypothetical protein [Eggerthellaceae bacterium]